MQVSDTRHYNLRYSHKGDWYSSLQSNVQSERMQALHYIPMYSHEGERYSPLQPKV